MDEIERKYGPSFYDRVDINFSDQKRKNYFKDFIANNHPRRICDYPVIDILFIDGIKFRLGDNYWLLFRFSGTEPLLRLYCEAPSKELLIATLNWAKNFVQSVS